MAKDIQILISAKDEASAKLRAVANESRTLDKAVGKLSAAKLIFDVTGLGQFSQAISAAEQGVSSLAQAQNGGAKSALAYQAALAGVVAVGGFKLGQYLSGAAADYKLLNEETAKSVQLEQQRLKLIALRGPASPQERQSGLKAAEGDIISLSGELEELKAKWGSSLGRGSEMIKLVSADLKEANQRFRDLMAAEAAANRSDAAAKAKAEQDAADRVTAAGLAGEKAQLEKFQSMRDALQKEIVTLRDGAKAAQLREVVPEYQAEIAALIDLKAALVAKAEAEKVDLKLQEDKRGILEQLAESQRAIKDEQAEEQARLKRGLTGDVGDLSGNESRFGIRGSVRQDPAREENKQLIKLNEKHKELLDELNETSKKIAENTSGNNNGTIGI